MGNQCCRQGEEFELSPLEKIDNNLVISSCDEVCEQATPTKKCPSTQDSKEIHETTEKFTDCAPQVTKIQALFRGCLARKAYPMHNLLKPAVIIKYITEQLKCVSKNKTNVMSCMEPFEVDWDMNEYRGKLELRKIALDEAGNLYLGYWNVISLKKEGYGQELYSNGAKYEGFLKSGEYEGKGRYFHENGDFYAGMWKNGKADGFGTFVGIDGMKYIGEWKDAEHHGKGFFTYLYYLLGKEIWPDGSTFEGLYVSGEKEGKGRFAWSDKSYYEGNFVKSQMCGQG